MINDDKLQYSKEERALIGEYKSAFGTDAGLDVLTTLKNLCDYGAPAFRLECRTAGIIRLEAWPISKEIVKQFQTVFTSDYGKNVLEHLMGVCDYGQNSYYMDSTLQNARYLDGQKYIVHCIKQIMEFDLLPAADTQLAIQLCLGSAMFYDGQKFIVHYILGTLNTNPDAVLADPLEQTGGELDDDKNAL